MAEAVVAFPPGPEGAHRVSNAGPEPARVLICSTKNRPDVAEHLDTGTWLAVTGEREGKFFPAGSEITIADAMSRAMEAGAAHDRDDDR